MPPPTPHTTSPPSTLTPKQSANQPLSSRCGGISGSHTTCFCILKNVQVKTTAEEIGGTTEQLHVLLRSPTWTGATSPNDWLAGGETSTWSLDCTFDRAAKTLSDSTSEGEIKQTVDGLFLHPQVETVVNKPESFVSIKGKVTTRFQRLLSGEAPQWSLYFWDVCETL